ncbi:MAG: outer membrane receptor for ferric coprogen and ferric-rhodotorulic acid [Betaproteobacteria bacterium]|nr:outer membrane receptor for ferric coprogen and ferric-rhodotorulic acid [Betaproteobacteria bacterium]
MRAAVLQSIVVATCLAGAPCATAGEREDLEQLRATTVNLIELLVEQGVLTREKAQELLRKAQVRSPDAVAPAGPNAPKVVRVPYVPEHVRDEIRESIKQEVLAQAKTERWGDPGVLPDWISRIAWEGDVRLRYQGDIFQSGNTPPAFFQIEGQNIDNTQEDRNRLRVRARLGVQARVSETVSAGARITTGSISDPISTTSTLGASGDRFAVRFDRAWLRLEPASWFALTGGRMPSPWLSTNLVWNDNLSFEGVAVRTQYAFDTGSSAFLTLGVAPVEEVQLSGRDKWLFGAQAGIDWSGARSRFRLAAALYDYRHITGRPNDALAPGLNDYTAAPFRQKGNSLFDLNQGVPGADPLFGLAAKFREANITARWDLMHLDPVHVMLTGDYVRNIAFDRGEILDRTGLDIAPRVNAYHARLAVGMPELRKQHDWQVFAAYKHVERDAVLDAFTDSDFHLGGTNAKGYILGGAYGIARNTWVNLRWLSSNQIDGPPLAIDVVQLDLNVRF